ncbi:MAG: hypothetical protein SVU94_12025 [Bacteroidota bacterium]|nr:hypothetical protein [Bacteroidota bacterium]
MDIKYPKHPYHSINLSFAGIIFLIFLYSGIFSVEKNNHPIKSACETITGEPCKSTGLSRSFSEIVRLQFESAKKYNPYSLKIFTFFLIQFFLRFFISFLIIKLSQHTHFIIISDTIFAVSLYTICFWEMIT